jgi:type II secretory pathway pseudopilin PulG
LLELAFVVAIIGILAGIAVPSFFATSGKSKATAEVTTMFSDLRTRLDQYYLENGLYPPTQSEAATWPAIPSTSSQPLLPLPVDWGVGPVGGPPGLRVRLSNDSDVYCGYAWITGRAAVVINVPNDVGNVGPIATSLGYTPPVTDWYYLFAHCDLDGDGSVDGYYISDRVDTSIRSVNPGH